MTAYDKRIVIQRWDDGQDDWDAGKPFASLHASVNKAQGREYADAGAERSVQELTFRVRWFSALKAIRTDTSRYRIVYDGGLYNIEDYDDYMEQHREVKLTASYYREAVANG